MLRNPKGARRYNDLITLTRANVVYDEFAHASVGDAVPVLEVYAQVRQMSATKTMLTFQQADVIGVDIEMRKPDVAFDGILWRGHEIHFPEPEDLDNRGRFIRVSGWYQKDDPVQDAPQAPEPEPEETITDETTETE